MPDALNYISIGGYVDKIHLHVTLSTVLREGDPEDVPITDTMRKDPFFCCNNKFSQFRGLPRQFSDIRKWKIVYNELISQYDKFIEVTNGRGDLKHIDFHLWYNLTWPVSLALRIFIRKYRIKSVRFLGVHQMNSIRYKVYRLLSYNHRVICIPASNIDYYLSKQHLFKQYPIIELYCHPNYKEGVLLDDSPSYLKHERQPFHKQISSLKASVDYDLLSWVDVK